MHLVLEVFQTRVAHFCLLPCLHKNGQLGARLRGRKATRRSKKGVEKDFKVLERVLRIGFAMGFTVQRGSEKGSQ